MNLSLTAKTTAVTATFAILLAGVLAAVSVDMKLDIVRDQAVDRQASSLRVATAVFKAAHPELSIERDAAGDIRRLSIDALPTFEDHAMIDEIGLITGETATVFAWEPENEDFWRRTTNIIKPDGERAVGTQLGQGGAVYPFMRRGETFRGEAVILGVAYYTIYEPIFDANDAVIGILYAGVEKARIDEAFDDFITTFLATVAIVTIGGLAIAVLLFRRLMRPVGAMCGTMRRLAADDVE
ncbi:MAG: Cache 3/Cache 2 fusion domain-containing protein, partial [Pseudomonadota bacterium]